MPNMYQQVADRRMENFRDTKKHMPFPGQIANVFIMIGLFFNVHFFANSR